MNERAEGWADVDKNLLAELGTAMRAATEVPDGFVQAGKATFGWHNIDAALARLTSDSAAADRDALAASGLRSGGTPQRSLTFTSDRLTIELDIAAEAIRGQVSPGQTGTARLHLDGSDALVVPIDEFGWFVLRPVPAVQFRLSVRLADGGAAWTEWIAP